MKKLLRLQLVHSKKNKYKIYLYSLPSTRGGMEFIRKNTHLWDRRINSYVDKAIIIPRAYSYSFDAEESLAYIVHRVRRWRKSARYMAGCCEI